MGRVRHGGYLGVYADKAGYFHVFSLYGTRKLPDWKNEIPVIVGDCKGGEELSCMVDVLIRELERLKKWGVKYSKSEKYRRDEIEAWTENAARMDYDDE